MADLQLIASGPRDVATVLYDPDVTVLPGSINPGTRYVLTYQNAIDGAGNNELAYSSGYAGFAPFWTSQAGSLWVHQERDYSHYASPAFNGDTVENSSAWLMTFDLTDVGPADAVAAPKLSFDWTVQASSFAHVVDPITLALDWWDRGAPTETLDTAAIASNWPQFVTRASGQLWTLDLSTMMAGAAIGGGEFVTPQRFTIDLNPDDIAQRAGGIARLRLMLLPQVTAMAFPDSPPPSGDYTLKTWVEGDMLTPSPMSDVLTGWTAQYPTLTLSTARPLIVVPPVPNYHTAERVLAAYRR